MQTKVKKVFLTLPSLKDGGTETQACLLATLLAREGLSIKVLLLRSCGIPDSPRLCAMLKEAGVELLHLDTRPLAGGFQPRPGISALRGLSILSRLLRDERPDAVLNFLTYCDFFGARAARKAGVPLIVNSIRSTALPAWKVALERWALRHWAHKLIYNSYAAAETWSNLGCPGRETLVIPNGLVPEPLRKEPAAAAKSISAAPNGCNAGHTPAADGSDEALTVACLGRFVPEKDFLTTIRVLSRVRQLLPENQPLRFLLAGYGPQEARLRRVVRDSGMESWTEFILSPRNPYAQVLSRAQVFLSTSRVEACSNSLMEAVQAGLPVVATDAGDSAQMLGKALPVISNDAPDRTGALAQALVRLLQDATLRAEIAQRQRENLLQRHSAERFRDTYLQLLEAPAGKTKRHIAFIGGRDLGTPGGIESFMDGLSRMLSLQGRDCTVFCESDHNGIEMRGDVRIVHLKGPRSRFIRKPWIALRATLLLIEALSRERRHPSPGCAPSGHVADIPAPDLIHYNAWPPALWAPLARCKGIPTLLMGHGFEWQRSKYSPLQQLILHAMERLTAQANRNLLLCSEEQTQYFRKHYHREGITIPTAVSLPEEKTGPNPAGEAARTESDFLTELGLQPGGYLLFLGRLSPEKNVHTLIEAFQLYQTRLSAHQEAGNGRPCGEGGLKLVIAGAAAGNGAYETRLKTLAAENPDILFPGAVLGEGKESLLRHANAFCLPSGIEGLSIALLEALAHRLPVIASDIPANREVLEDRAFYAPAEDTAALADAIARSQSESRSDWTEENYRRVVRDYTWESVCRRYRSAVDRMF